MPNFHTQPVQINNQVMNFLFQVTGFLIPFTVSSISAAALPYLPALPGYQGFVKSITRITQFSNGIVHAIGGIRPDVTRERHVNILPILKSAKY